MFLDKIGDTSDNSVGKQTAASIFARVVDSAALDGAGAIANCFIEQEEVNRAGEDFTVYKLRAKNGRTARIFTYFNDLYGVTGVIEMEQNGKQVAAGR